MGCLSPQFFTPLLVVAPPPSTAYCSSPPPFSSPISLPNTYSSFSSSSSSSSSLVWSPRRRYLPLKPLARLFHKDAEYVFPDPVPEFAESETNKFRIHLLEKLSKKTKKDMFGDSLEEVVRVCSEEGLKLHGQQSCGRRSTLTRTGINGSVEKVVMIIVTMEHHDNLQSGLGMENLVVAIYIYGH